MALVVEDGTGLSTSESFCSVAEANTYHASYGNTAWTGEDETEREIHLRIASQYMEAKFAKRWKGRRILSTQALSWPRYDVEDDDGYCVDSNIVPAAVKQACAVLALKSLSGTDLTPDLSSGSVKRTKVKVGDIEEETEYTSAKREETAFNLAEGLLRRYLEPVGRIYRG